MSNKVSHFKLNKVSAGDNKVFIIILNWNGLRDTIECLDSLRKIDYTNFEVIVVDNASCDNCTIEITKLFPEVILIQNRENLGFAEGNNVGIRYALKNGAAYILLLNNDTIVDSEILKTFVEAASVYPDAGVFGAKIYYYNEPNKIWFAGGKWNTRKMCFAHTGQGELENSKKYNDIEEVDYVCGCCLFFSEEVAQKVGLLEPKFYLTYEETDWCYRARKAGFKALFVPNARLWHKVSASIVKDSPLFAYFMVRNRLLWAKRNLPFLQKWFVYLTTFREFFPCAFDSNKFSFIYRLYCDISNNFKNYYIFQSKIIGMRDFIFKHFGSCPASIHKMNKKFKIQESMK